MRNQSFSAAGMTQCSFSARCQRTLLPKRHPLETRRGQIEKFSCPQPELPSPTGNDLDANVSRRLPRNELPQFFEFYDSSDRKTGFTSASGYSRASRSATHVHNLFALRKRASHVLEAAGEIWLMHDTTIHGLRESSGSKFASQKRCSTSQ